MIVFLLSLTYPWSWSTLPDCEMQDRLEIVLAPSTMVALPDISPGLVRGPGSIMSPEITGRESRPENWENFF